MSITTHVLLESPPEYIISYLCNSLHNFHWNFSQISNPHHGWGKTSNSWFLDYWKMQLQVKKRIKTFLLTNPHAKFSPRFSSSLPGWGKLFTPSRQHFFQNLYFLTGGTMIYINTTKTKKILKNWLYCRFYRDYIKHNIKYIYHLQTN